jgi:hypothetical protein
MSWNTKPAEYEPDLQFPVSADCAVSITFHGNPTREAISRLIQFLELSKDYYPTEPKNMTLNRSVPPAAA